MQFILFVYGDSDEVAVYTAPVPESDAAYLRRAASTLRPLSDEDYLNGPSCLLNTPAKYSYVLDGSDVYWCIEWDPGLLVIRFSPDGAMHWTALRSPVPNFGGRDATEAEMEAYDEDADNPQYNLIFDPWDAQFDAELRALNSFVRASDDVLARFYAAVDRANDLKEADSFLPDDEQRAWTDQCIKNLEEWAGDGVRLE